LSDKHRGTRPDDDVSTDARFNSAAVKPAKKKRYNWPPPPKPEDVYVPKERNPIHSVLTALPIIMLVTGLYFYYEKESEQSGGEPIFEQSEVASGIFTGLSVVKSGAQGRHYLWFEQNGKARGVRVKPLQAEALQALNRGEPIELKIAPTVSESTVYWAWYVEQSDEVFLNVQESVQQAD